MAISPGENHLGCGAFGAWPDHLQSAYIIKAILFTAIHLKKRFN
jgi:hypothetical protein